MARKTIALEHFINFDLEPNKRFDLAQFLNYDEDSYEPLNSSILNTLRDLPSGGLYTVRGEEGRPDLISFRLYEDTQYWWIILLYNGKVSVNDIIHSEQIEYPKLSALEDFYFSLKTKQAASDRDV